MDITLAHRPPIQHAGRTLLIAVIGFGAATIMFGFSTSFILSLLLRGPVQAVNSIFTSTSNEMGAFESEFAASLLGPVVVGGGIGTIIVVLMVGWIFPESVEI